jgi:membrane protease YdiL (CAAX protease family)
MTFAGDRTFNPTPPPPWGILATVAWLVLAFAISALAAVGLFAAFPVERLHAAIASYDGVLIAAGTLGSIPVQIAVLAIAAHLRQWSPLSYLGINVPRRGEIIFALICMLALDIAFNLLLYVTGHDIVAPFQVDAYRSAKDAGWLLALLAAIVVVAPIGEEVAFRGFLYRGLARPGREIHAIVVISLAWAVLHIQYDWLGMVQIFAIGLVLGWFRWASGSTTLTIAMHVLVNFEAMIETVIKVEVLS